MLISQKDGGKAMLSFQLFTFKDVSILACNKTGGQTEYILTGCVQQQNKTTGKKEASCLVVVI